MAAARLGVLGDPRAIPRTFEERFPALLRPLLDLCVFLSPSIAVRGVGRGGADVVAVVLLHGGGRRGERGGGKEAHLSRRSRVLRGERRWSRRVRRSSVGGRVSFVNDGVHEAVTMLEEIERIARRVLGGTNPTVGSIVRALQAAREKLHARESPNARA